MPRSDLQNLFQLLSPFPGRLEFTLRLSLICALTTLATAMYQTPEPALTVYIVFFMNKPDRVTSLILNAALVVVITVAIAIIFAITREVIDEPLWRVASIAVVSFIFLFMASASKLQPIASTVALIIAYALDLLGSSPTAELVTRALLYAWLFIGIPAGVSIVVNLLIAPAPRRLVESALAERLHLAAAMLREPGERIRGKFRTLMYEGAGEILKGLKLAGLEGTSAKEDIAALGKATQSTTAILLLVDMMDRETIAIPQAACNSIALALDDMAEIIKKGGYPVEITLDAPNSGEPLSPLAARVVDDMRRAITEFAEPLPEKAPPAPKGKEGGFFVPDAFTNPDHTHYALKATAAAMICYLLYTLLDWPGIHTSFLTCYIVSLGTTAETVEKLSLRIAGCLLGAVIGIGAIVFVIPHLTSIGTLMALVFAGTFIAGWVATGTPRISYAGFQIAFAFFLCVIQGTKPGFDLVVARDRIIGILLCNLVVYLIFTNVWPVSVKQRIDTAIAGLLRQLAQMATATSQSIRLALASQSQGAMGAIEQNLLIAGYEPGDIRPSPDWIGTRREAMHSVEELIGPLFLEAHVDVTSSASSARQLIQQAEALSPVPAADHPIEDAVSPETHASKAVAPDLRAMIDMRLRNLQKSLDQQPLEHRAAHYAST